MNFDDIGYAHFKVTKFAIRSTKIPHSKLPSNRSQSNSPVMISSINIVNNYIIEP